MIDVKKLQTLTEDAIERGRIAAIEHKAREDEKEALRVKVAEQWVENQVIELEARITTAAAEGKYKCKVVEVNEYDVMVDTNERDNLEFKLDTIGLRYHYLKDTLYKIGLHPTVKFCHDGVGIRSWYEMWVDWEPIKMPPLHAS